MGCDIYSFGERKVRDRWICVHAPLTPFGYDFDRFLARDIAYTRPGAVRELDSLPTEPEPFAGVCYPHFAFLADVRNYWEIPPISQPRGLPEDASAYVRYAYWEDPFVRDKPREDSHSASWLTTQELIDFDYDRSFEDQAPTYEQGGQWYYKYKMIEAAHGGRTKTYREFLGPEFLQRLHALKSARVERLVFWFDN